MSPLLATTPKLVLWPAPQSNDAPMPLDIENQLASMRVQADAGFQECMRASLPFDYPHPKKLRAWREAQRWVRTYVQLADRYLRHQQIAKTHPVEEVKIELIEPLDKAPSDLGG